MRWEQEDAEVADGEGWNFEVGVGGMSRPCARAEWLSVLGVSSRPPNDADNRVGYKWSDLCAVLRAGVERGSPAHIKAVILGPAHERREILGVLGAHLFELEHGLPLTTVVEKSDG